jgi:hypothetical protein
MTMIVSVEEVPQIQPAECSFGGGGANVNSKFLRVVNPDMGTDTLLIGDVMFREFAKAMGYIPKDEAVALVEALREEVKKANAAFDDVTASINASRSVVDALENVSGVLETVRDSLNTASAIATGVDESSDGTSEPVAKS